MALKDARDILKFQQEYVNTTKQGYIICNTLYAVGITDNNCVVMMEMD